MKNLLCCFRGIDCRIYVEGGNKTKLNIIFPKILGETE